MKLCACGLCSSCRRGAGAAGGCRPGRRPTYRRPVRPPPAGLAGPLPRTPRWKSGRCTSISSKAPAFRSTMSRSTKTPPSASSPWCTYRSRARLDVVPSIWSLLGGRFVIASIRLDGASINLTKSGPASEWGRWNFASIVNPSVIRTAPAIHVRDSRIHFKFGDTKSVFYLTETDLDVSPPGPGGDWKLVARRQPGAHRPAGPGLGSFRLEGRWYADPGRVDLDMQVDRAALGEVPPCSRGRTPACTASSPSRLHLAGPCEHRHHRAARYRRRPSLGPAARQRPGLAAGDARPARSDQSATGTALDNRRERDLPLTVHFRATDYLSQPHWAVALNWNRFPVAPILRTGPPHGRAVPAPAPAQRHHGWRHRLFGTGRRAGRPGFHDAALTIPDSPPVRFEQAHSFSATATRALAHRRARRRTTTRRASRPTTIQR